MARTVRLPRSPWAQPGTQKEQTAGEWLTGQMQERRIANCELFARMQRLGYHGNSSNIVSQWRSGDTAISLHILPTLLDALGMATKEKRLWARHFMCEELPELWPLFEEAA